ncbi:MAG: xylose isomerase [Flavobacteriales bacterium 32-34-25]|nr:MAG: xylose isomerase [Flavobacteriales bacterium 32-34-25]
MNKRREFLIQFGLLAGGMCILPSFTSVLNDHGKRKFGIQLYSLRDELPKGVENVIKNIANAGYSYVEGYGYSEKDGFWGLNPKTFKEMLSKYNLTCPSSHYDFGEYEQSGDLNIIKNYIEVAKGIGNEYIVIPYINPEIYKDEDKTKSWLVKLNKAAKLIKSEGLKLAYHNHQIEFYKMPNGKTGYEMLLEGTKPELVDFEMDIYWVINAGYDPIQLFKRYPNRFSLWHVKDMDKSNSSKNTEIGNGSIDFKIIFKSEKLAGMKYAFMEQENFDIDAFESINKSFKYLKHTL